MQAHSVVRGVRLARVITGSSLKIFFFLSDGAGASVNVESKAYVFDGDFAQKVSIRGLNLLHKSHVGANKG